MAWVVVYFAVGVALLGGFCVGLLTKDVIKPKEKPKPICDRCKNLVKKNKPGPCTFAYLCQRYQGFDKTPIYCRDFQEREADEVIRSVNPPQK